MPDKQKKPDAKAQGKQRPAPNFAPLDREQWIARALAAAARHKRTADRESD